MQTVFRPLVNQRNNTIAYGGARECSPIIIQNGSSNPSSRKNFSSNPSSRIGLMTVRASVQDATFNMRGQLYRGQANATALSSRPEVSALGVVPLRSAGKKCELHFWDG